MLVAANNNAGGLPMMSMFYVTSRSWLRAKIRARSYEPGSRPYCLHRLPLWLPGLGVRPRGWKSSRRPRLRGQIAPLWDSLHCLAELLPREVKLIGALEVHPEIRRHAEVPAEAQGRVRSHVPFPGKNLVE